jgi:hypothetical protein
MQGFQGVHPEVKAPLVFRHGCRGLNGLEGRKQGISPSPESVSIRIISAIRGQKNSPS